MSWIKVKSEYNDLDKYEDDNGDIFYCKKDTALLHNSYSPAIVCENGYKAYYIDNKKHRLDGPAIIYSNGGEAYCINGKLLNKKEFEMHPERLKYLGKEYLLCLK